MLAQVLGVERGASPQAIKKAHRQLAITHHPDKVDAERQEEAKKLMQRINWAKEVLLPSPVQKSS